MLLETFHGVGINGGASLAKLLNNWDVSVPAELDALYPLEAQKAVFFLVTTWTLGRENFLFWGHNNMDTWDYAGGTLRSCQETHRIPSLRSPHQHERVARAWESMDPNPSMNHYCKTKTQEVFFLVQLKREK